MLEFISIQKFYGRRQVLDIPSLQLEKGIFWLQGANGSGKTTLLRMTGGLLPFKGDIRLDGVSLRKDPVSYRRAVSWSDAEPLYPAFLSGEDLLSFYLDIRGVSRDKAEYLVNLFQVRSYLASPIGTYSSGMVKKLSLLLAFVGDPSLIILDEPLVTLDHEAIPVVYRLVKETWHQKGTCFLISSHQELQASDLPITQKLTVAGQTLVSSI